LGVQYWTSRGFAFLDVDYGGSSGYGKRYRERLRGNWGIVDVNDSVAAVYHLIQEGLASQAAIFGGSAGGYTTLQALVHHSSLFKAGASLYGVAELSALASDTQFVKS
jgi:dipeptidyl aminopeptidase/acylaminoacyl peptidase